MIINFKDFLNEKMGVSNDILVLTKDIINNFVEKTKLLNEICNHMI